MSVWINTQFSDDWEAGPPKVTSPEDHDSILDMRKGFPGGMGDKSRRKPGGILVQSWHQLWHQLSPPCHLSPGSPLCLLTTCHFLLGSSCNKLHHCTSVFKILCCQEQSLVMSLNLSPGKWLMPEKTSLSFQGFRWWLWWWNPVTTVIYPCFPLRAVTTASLMKSNSLFSCLISDAKADRKAVFFFFFLYYLFDLRIFFKFYFIF